MKNYSPWAYIPSLYFLEGLPYVLINVVSAALYTKLGISNDVFAFWTGFLYLPWTLKMFWSPLVDSRFCIYRFIIKLGFFFYSFFTGLCRWGFCICHM